MHPIVSVPSILYSYLENHSYMPLVKSIAPHTVGYSKGRDVLLHLTQHCQISFSVFFQENNCQLMQTQKHKAFQSRPECQQTRPDLENVVNVLDKYLNLILWGIEVNCILCLILSLADIYSMLRSKNFYYEDW